MIVLESAENDYVLPQSIAFVTHSFAEHRRLK